MLEAVGCKLGELGAELKRFGSTFGASEVFHGCPVRKVHRPAEVVARICIPSAFFALT